jgi:hypothetical protein
MQARVYIAQRFLIQLQTVGIFFLAANQKYFNPRKIASHQLSQRQPHPVGVALSDLLNR